MTKIPHHSEPTLQETLDDLIGRSVCTYSTPHGYRMTHGQVLRIDARLRRFGVRCDPDTDFSSPGASLRLLPLEGNT